VSPTEHFATAGRPRFSVCLPVWNGAHLVDIAIEGVLSQTEQRWQLVVGDNASNDNLAEAVARYRDPRISYHRWDARVGAEENFNRTMALAEGDWVIPIGADDRLDATALASMLSAIDGARSNDPADSRSPSMVVAACRRVFPDGSPADAFYYGSQRPVVVSAGRHGASAWRRVAATGGPFPWNIGSVAFWRPALERAGRMRPQVGVAADMELVFRIAAHGDVIYLPEALLDFTVRTESDGNRRWAANRRRGDPLTPLARALLAALAAHEAMGPVPRSDRRMIEAAAARTLFRRAAQHRTLAWGRGWRGAVADVARGVRLQPAAVLSPEALLLTGGALMAPSWLLRRVSAAIRDRTHGSAAVSIPTRDASPSATVASNRG
jgi:glycosyltransferase involved in cell wall biosynthesis